MFQARFALCFCFSFCCFRASESAGICLTAVVIMRRISRLFSLGIWLGVVLATSVWPRCTPLRAIGTRFPLRRARTTDCHPNIGRRSGLLDKKACFLRVICAEDAATVKNFRRFPPASACVYKPQGMGHLSVLPYPTLSKRSSTQNTHIHTHTHTQIPSLNPV